MSKEVITRAEAMPLVLTPADVAQVLQISRNKTYELFHRKGFPAFRVGNLYRINRDKFIQWMDGESASDLFAYAS